MWKEQKKLANSPSQYFLRQLNNILEDWKFFLLLSVLTYLGILKAPDTY